MVADPSVTATCAPPPCTRMQALESLAASQRHVVRPLPAVQEAPAAGPSPAKRKAPANSSTLGTASGYRPASTAAGPSARPSPRTPLASRGPPAPSSTRLAATAAAASPKPAYGHQPPHIGVQAASAASPYSQPAPAAGRADASPRGAPTRPGGDAGDAWQLEGSPQALLQEQLQGAGGHGAHEGVSAQASYDDELQEMLQRYRPGGAASGGQPKPQGVTHAPEDELMQRYRTTSASSPAVGARGGPSADDTQRLIDFGYTGMGS